MARKKQRTHTVSVSAIPTPKSIIINSNSLSREHQTLMRELRRSFEPNTASKIKRRNNSTRDYVHVAAQLGVTHLLLLTQANAGHLNLRIATLPRGPALCFNIHSYILPSALHSMQHRPRSHAGSIDTTPPLVVLQGFGQTGDAKTDAWVALVRTTLSSMYPTLNVSKVNVNTAKRVVLYTLDAATQKLEFRHYAIALTPKFSKPVTHILKPKSFRSVEVCIEALTGHVPFDSESEGEAEVVEIQSKLRVQSNGAKRGGGAKETSVRLAEMGPRITMNLVKITASLSLKSETLFHCRIQRSEEEVEGDKKRRGEADEKRKLRREAQERNVKAKNGGKDIEDGDETVEGDFEQDLMSGQEDGGEYDSEYDYDE